jgi:hypothetical protein
LVRQFAGGLHTSLKAKEASKVCSNVGLIKNQFALTDLADSLQHANDIQTIVYVKHEAKRDFQNYINAGNELRKNKEYQKCEEDFKKQRPLLIERLYEFVKNNAAQYP